MGHMETVTECPFFEVSETGVWDIIQSPVTENLQQRFVVYN